MELAPLALSYEALPSALLSLFVVLECLAPRASLGGREGAEGRAMPWTPRTHSGCGGDVQGIVSSVDVGTSPVGRSVASVGRWGAADNGSGRYSCAVAACARSSGHSLGAGLLSPEGGCRAWHSFAIRGLLDPVTAPGCALGGRTGSDPGGAAEAVPHKRLAMLVHGASHPDARVFRSLAVPLHPLAQALEWTLY